MSKLIVWINEKRFKQLRIYIKIIDLEFTLKYRTIISATIATLFLGMVFSFRIILGNFK